MSDQVPSQSNSKTIDGKNLINVGGSGITSINGDVNVAQTLNAGTGITIVDGGGGSHVISVSGGGGLVSINGDATAAQVFTAGSGITIVNGGGGSHTISAVGGTGVLSINGDGAAAQTIVAGANITVTDLGGGQHRIAAAGGGTGNITSINADVTPAQTFTAGAGISIVNGGGGSHTISLTGAAGLTSINADTTPAQVLTSLTTALTIAHPGGGAHNFSISTFSTVLSGIVPPSGTTERANALCADGTWQNPCRQRGSASGGGGLALPNGSLTDITSFVVGAGTTGPCIILFQAGVNGIAGQFMDVVLRINGAFVTGTSGLVEAAGQTLSAFGSFVQNLAAGDTVAVAIDHHGGGAGTTSTGGTITAHRVGN